jgi:hypothetical protein
VLQIPDGWNDFCTGWRKRMVQRAGTKGLTEICQLTVLGFLKQVYEDYWTSSFVSCIDTCRGSGVARFVDAQDQQSWWPPPTEIIKVEKNHNYLLDFLLFVSIIEICWLQKIKFFNLKCSFLHLLDSAVWGGCTTRPTLAVPLCRCTWILEIPDD